MKEAEEYCPGSRQDWRNWLASNHEKKDSIWLIFYKKKSPLHNLTWSESVDEALCFGWIDSIKKSIDSERFKQYFSKRKAKSNWSKINKDKIKLLSEQGLMAPAGYNSIEIAKENGSWTLLDEIEALVVPHELKEELKKEEGAWDFFNALSRSKRKILLYWVISAKRPETKLKRIKEIMENVSKERIPERFR